MLKTLDILIGVATIMLLFSMAVTIITQAVATFREYRGKRLLEGLASLLHQIDPQLEKAVATKIANAVLTHPLVAGPNGKLGEVIHREEFTMLLMSFATDDGPTKLEATAKQKLVEVLEKNGIADPAETLRNVRAAALQIEAANPELANDVRYSMAVLREAKSQYVAKIHGWFDQTIDRVGARFTLNARIITFVAALIVAVTVQLDTFALVNRLSMDDQFRDAVRQPAQQLLDALPSPTPTPAPSADNAVAPAASPAAAASPTAAASPAASPATSPAASPTKSASPAARSTPSGTPSSGSPASAENTGAATTPSAANTTTPSGKANSKQSVSEIQQRYYDLLSQAGLVTLPGKDWGTRFELGKVPGILLSTLLLSLGAPFWYTRLQDLLRLRSALAQKDEAQRVTRQTTQTPGTDEGSTAPPAVAAAVVVTGERGDLNAVG